jgi:hypothetical protein
VIQNEGGPEGGFVGRILGMLIVLGAVAVLSVGALNFVGGLGADGTPRPTGPAPTLVAVGSPSPGPAPISPTSPPATLAPIATPPPTAQPEPTADAPEGTPFVVDVEEGRGHITFGTGRGGDLRVANPRASFELGERPFYSAQLRETSLTDRIRIEVRRYDPGEGGETAVAELNLATNLPRVHTVRQRLDTSALDGPGVYVMRFVAGDDVQAEGWFEVTET